jgi:probable rRNA maturation factor
VIEVVVEDAAWTGALPDPESLAADAADAALAEGVRPPREGDPEAVEAADAGLVVLLTDDATVRDLNARFRGKDSATNVLAFPAPSNPERHLGDVALAYGVCAREAAEQGKPLGRHLQHLVVHGVLHLLGYDHMSDDEAEAMEGLERIVLAGLGAPDPYQADGTDHD